MRLRARLAVATALVTVPLAIGLTWLDAHGRYVATQEDLRWIALGHMEREGERARCEADPEAWDGVPVPPGPPHDRGLDLDVLDGRPGHGPHESGRPLPPPGSRDRNARRDEAPPGRRGANGEPGPGEIGDEPPLLFAYARDLTPSSARSPVLTEVPGVPFFPPDDVLVLVDMPWSEGPCARILARGSQNPNWSGGLIPGVHVWLVPVLAILVGVLLAVEPVLRRTSRLAERVRRAAQEGFRSPVPVEGDDEIADVARAFVGASEEIRLQLGEKDARDRALRDFVSNTTHDVVIPLTVLQGHLASLREAQKEQRPVDDAVVAAAMNEAHYLGALLHNLGAAARIEGTLPARQDPLELGALVMRVVARHRSIADALGVELVSATPDEDVPFLGDETLVEQAVNNLVYNAIRHNRPGGHVAITLESLREGGFEVRVVDDGPGVDEALLARLSERGFRGDDARSRHPDGQGLGLAIVHEVAARHALALRFARAEEGGLEVTLTHRAATEA